MLFLFIFELDVEPSFNHYKLHFRSFDRVINRVAI